MFCIECGAQFPVPQAEPPPQAEAAPPEPQYAPPPPPEQPQYAPPLPQENLQYQQPQPQYPEQPQYAQPQPQQYPQYPYPPPPPPRKKSKVGLILGIVIPVVLLAAAAAVVFFVDPFDWLNNDNDPNAHVGIPTTDPNIQNTPTPTSTPTPTLPPDTPPPTTAIIDDGIKVNWELLQMIGKTNADLIAVNGGRAPSYVADGGAWVDYTESGAIFPVHFYFDMDHDTFIDIIYDNRSGLDWNTNIWPSNATVFAVLLWREQAFTAFEHDKPITYDALCEVFEVDPGLEFFPEHDQGPDSYGADVWTSWFVFDRYMMYTAFESKNNEMVLLEAWIAEDQGWW